MYKCYIIHPGFLYSSCVSFVAVIIFLVDSSYSGVPGLPWYRFSKYLAICSFVSSGSVNSFPSSVIVLYSNSLLLLACLLACHMQFGSILVLLMSSRILFSVCSASNFSILSLVCFCVSMYFFNVFSFWLCDPVLHAVSNSLFACFLSSFFGFNFLGLWFSCFICSYFCHSHYLF